jgi:hypothetical protein
MRSLGGHGHTGDLRPDLTSEHHFMAVCWSRAEMVPRVAGEVIGP